MGDDRLGILLKIVRRKHVVFRGNECLEEAPGAARDQPEGARIIRMYCETAGDRRAAYLRLARRKRRQHPQCREWRSDRPGVLPGDVEANADKCCKGESGCDLRRESPPIELRVIARLRRRDPFQQMPPADRYAEERAADCIGHHPCLMGKESEQEGALQKPQFEITAQRTEVIAR